MPSLPAKGFHVPTVNRAYPAALGVARTGYLDFTTQDLAHALFTTGRAPGDQMQHGYASVWEALHRCSLIPAYIRRDSSGGLLRSRLALELDRSEKGSLSYALGQAVTSIFCARTFGTTHLLHVDRYGGHYSLVFAPGKTRADLFGPSTKGWVIAEAKGRTNGADAELVKKLQTQKRSIKTIMGSKPYVALGCVACFPQPKRPYMKALTWDPVDDEPEAVNVQLTMAQYMRAYYEPVLAALNLQGVSSLGAYAVADFEGLGLRVGLRADLLDALLSNDDDQTVRLALGPSFDHFYPGNNQRPDRPTRPQDLRTDESEINEQSADEEGDGDPGRLDEELAGTTFPDLTLFATNWEAAMETDDRERFG